MGWSGRRAATAAEGAERLRHACHGQGQAAFCVLASGEAAGPEGSPPLTHPGSFALQDMLLSQLCAAAAVRVRTWGCSPWSACVIIAWRHHQMSSERAATDDHQAALCISTYATSPGMLHMHLPSAMPGHNACLLAPAAAHRPMYMCTHTCADAPVAAVCAQACAWQLRVRLVQRAKAWSVCVRDLGIPRCVCTTGICITLLAIRRRQQWKADSEHTCVCITAAASSTLGALNVFL